MSDSEFSRIEQLLALFAPSAAAEPAVSLGIGDDCAVLAPSAHELAISVDAQVEGVHFRSEWWDDERIGYRASVAALSDLAAMAAMPLAMVSSLALPKGQGARALGLARGQAQAAREYGVAVIGGNLTAASEVAIHSTVFGRLQQPAVRRDGAQVGDWLYLAGDVGHAALGLRALLRGQAHEPDALPFVQRFAVPRAEFAAARAIAPWAHAMLDVSDGLAQDAGHMARASDVQLWLDPAAVQALCAPLQSLCALWGLSAEELVLAGGEDYALLSAAPAGLALPGWRAVGEVRAGRGVWLGDAERRVAGHDHFAD